MAKTRRARAQSDTGTLSPSQQSAYDSLCASLEFGAISVVWGAPGFGKTTILKELHKKRLPKATFISASDFLTEMRDHHPLRLEETFGELMRKALKKSREIIVDDIHLLNGLFCCNHMYQRKDYFNEVMTAIVDEATQANKMMIFGSNSSTPGPIHQRAYYHGVKKLTPEDYAHLTRAYLPKETWERIDFPKVHRFAPKLTGHQLRGAADELAHDPALDTQKLIDYVRSRRMASNVDLAEVQAVELSMLKGLDDVIESLEANVVLPFENDKLATELKIKPKRGVLLIGPPGTGKTTVGRALAHRLRSKFFLIDGTIISGTQAFYEQIQQVTEAAKRNAPSIIFIDDSDVIFEQGREQGLYRYLLTMLDGIESDTSGRICVMMTAMDVSSLPPALIRSGRIELWLETRLPNEQARLEILRDLGKDLPAVMPAPDLQQIAAATEGLTGADIKRLVEDSKLLYAYDRARERPLKSTTEYLLAAIEPVRANKQRYQEAEARVRALAASRPAQPDYSDYYIENEAEPA